MYAVVVTEKGGEQRRLEFEKNEVTIGRVQGNDVILPKGNVSKRHSRIVVKDGKFIIVDLKSTNGTYVNGRKITSPLVIKASDRVYIGDFILHIDDGSGAAAADPGLAPPPPPQAQAGRRSSQPPPRRPAPSEAPPPPRRSPPEAPPERPAYMDEDEGLGAMGDPAAATPPPQQQAPPPQQQHEPPPQQQEPPPQQQQEPPQQQQPAPPQAPEPEPEAYAQEEPPAQAAPAAPPRQKRPRRRPTRGGRPAQRKPARREIPPPQQAPASADEGDGFEDAATPVPQERSAPKRAPKRKKKAVPKQAQVSDAKRGKIIELQNEVHDRLIDRMDLRRLNMDELDDDELREKAENHIAEIVSQMDGQGNIPAFINQEALIEDVLNEALGLGPLEEYLDDDTITEIMVNRADQIYLEIEGKLTLADKVFSSDKSVLGIIERIVAPIGRRIDESSPLVDARLKDGSRVNAIIPPLALKGPCITIRKFKKEMLGPQELVNYGTLTGGMVDFINMCVVSRRNMVISGGTGSGKTTTLNILSNFIPDGERLVTVEDAAELQLVADHWIQLESRPANVEGTGQITIRDLVKNCLRMRPDRIIVGECRSGETLDMLQAMNTGHDGSLTTVHANTPRDALARLETMVLMSGMDLPIKAIREQIGAAIHIILQQSRFSDGSRKVTHISEITGMEGEVITMQDIFVYKQEGFDDDNRIVGRFVPTGFIPRFYEDLRRRGVEVDMGIFRE